MSVVVPYTGELLDVKQATTTELAEAVTHVADAETDLRSAKRAISDELVERLDHEGKRSVTIGDFRIEATAPTQKTWDLDRLQATLAGLAAADTISLAKAQACIRHKPEAVWNELRTLDSDPRTRDAIRACYTEEDAPRYVRVKQHG